MITDPKKCRKWGQICLVSAILLNGFVLAISLYLSSLQGELQSKRYDEQYFIINDQTKKAEIAKYRMLQGNSNQLVLLRRLADDRLTREERNTILNNVKELNRQAEVSKVNITALSYILVNDPPKGTNLYKMFVGNSDSELVRLQELYEKQAAEYLTNLKERMVQLMDNISIWQYVHSIALVLSMIILIIGSILNLRSEYIVSTD